MSGDVVARARELLIGVTEGPWMAGKGGSGYSNWVDSKPDLVNISIADRIDILADAEFIAETRQLVPELVAEVEKLRGALETIRDLASTTSFDPLSGLLDILAVIERAGIEP